MKHIHTGNLAGHMVLYRPKEMQRSVRNEYLDREMELAIRYFNDNYNTAISVEEYAASRGMSVSWYHKLQHQRNQQYCGVRQSSVF